MTKWLALSWWNDSLSLSLSISLRSLNFLLTYMKKCLFPFHNFFFYKKQQFINIEKRGTYKISFPQFYTCIICLWTQMKQMVEIYIKLAELETRREVSEIEISGIFVSCFFFFHCKVLVTKWLTLLNSCCQEKVHSFFKATTFNLILLYFITCAQDTNKRIMLPRDLRNLQQLELVRKHCYKEIFLFNWFLNVAQSICKCLLSWYW